MRALPLLTALALLGTQAGPLRAAEPLALHLDGRRVELREGLQKTADERVWITRGDAERALGLALKRLIPRPIAGRVPQPRREKDDWVLCGRERCAPYRAEVLGTLDAPTFDLARLASTLGYRLRRQAEALWLTSPRSAGRRTQAPARIGSLVPDLALPCLDGGTRRLADHPGRRLLLVTWAPWSATRTELQAWRAAHAQRPDRHLEIWFAALDVEGAVRVRDYVDVGFDAPVAVDRHAALAAALPLQDVGHWYFVDELGVLRAEGDHLDAVALQWIDLHLDEPLAQVAPPARTAPPAPTVATLRAQVAAQPRGVAARVALLEQLTAGDRAEALRVAAEVVALQPKVPTHALRLAALHLDEGDLPAALAVLDDARRRTPQAWILRQQYWALEHPERFYAGPIDVRWIQEQRRKEREAFDRPRRRR